MKIYRNMIFIIILAMMLIVSGCNSQAEVNQKTDSANNKATGMSSAFIAGDVQKIEIYHFHGTNQCTSCIAVGKLAEETVNTYFADELKSGKIIFNHINAELPENYELAKKYGVTGSSLWIGTYRTDGQFKAEQNINVWYKIDNKEEYMTYLKGVIEQKLSEG